MKRKIFIEGMSCEHCVKRVKVALEELNGVETVSINLELNTADVELNTDITNELLIETIDEAGYDVVKIENL